MKFVVITSDSYFSYLLLSCLLREHRERVALLIESRAIGRKGGPVGVVKKLVQRSGWRGAAYKVGPALWVSGLDRCARLLPWVGRSFTPTHLAARCGIPIRACADANGPDCLAALRQVGPDLVFAVNVYQKLKTGFLSLPRLGVVNVHFGLLPHYRGMSPYMWAMACGESEIGLTAHFMDEDFDTGDIIEQSTVPIRPRDSVFGVYVRGCLEARRMLSGIAVQAVAGSIPRRAQSRDEGSYFSMPDAACLHGIRSRGHQLVTAGDMVRVARRRAAGDVLP